MKRRYRKDLLSPTNNRVYFASDDDELNENAVRVETREEAIKQGYKYYFTKRPCKRGHLAARYTSTFSCVTCQRQTMKEKMRQKYADWAKMRKDANKE